MNTKIAECMVSDSEFELWCNNQKFRIIRYLNGERVGHLYIDDITYLKDDEYGGKYFKALKIFAPIIEKYINLL